MARVSFENMPFDGPRDPRSTARIMNQAMNGKLNAVVDFTIPVAGLPFVFQDIRISPQSYVELMPLNAAARLSEVLFLPGDGFLVVEEVEEEFQNAIVQVTENESVAVLDMVAFVEEIIPFDNISLNVNFGVDLTDDPVNRLPRITSQISGIITTTFTFSGTFSVNGFDGHVGLHGYRPNPPGPDLDLGSFLVGYSTGNQNAGIAAGGTILIPSVQPGDYYNAVIEISKTGTFLPYELTLILDSETGLGGAFPGQELEYRALIIG